VIHGHLRRALLASEDLEENENERAVVVSAEGDGMMNE